MPFIVGYLGDIDPASPADVNATTVTGPALGAIDVIANLTATTNTSGGVAEFEIANPTVGLQGSGTADAPSIVPTWFRRAQRRPMQANLRDTTAARTMPRSSHRPVSDPGRRSWTNFPGRPFHRRTSPRRATR